MTDIILLIKQQLVIHSTLNLDWKKEKTHITLHSKPQGEIYYIKML